MPSTEAIILAGGFGTRLRGTIGEIPKCMAPVAGKPFLHYLLRYLAGQHVSHIVLSLGYKSEAIIEWLKGESLPFTISWVIEEEPLGTGGGIRLAMEKCQEADVFVVNGDTMFNVDLQEMYYWHLREDAETTIALKMMKNFDRYGTVRMANDGTIISFEEKAAKAQGNINGGIYIIDREAFMQRTLPQKCSFEKDYLERYVTDKKFHGWESDAYFIDIGIPQDYQQAQLDFQTLFPA